MKAITLHDKFDEDIIGTVLLNENVNFDDVCTAWDLYQEHYNSNRNNEPDIYEFEQNYGESIGFEVLELDFYQP